MKQQKNWSEMTPKEKVFGCSNLLLFNFLLCYCDMGSFEM